MGEGNELIEDGSVSLLRTLSDTAQHRGAPPGYVYHVLNQGVGRTTLFEKPGDYQAFLAVLRQALEATPAVELLVYCVMPNHWHLGSAREAITKDASTLEDRDALNKAEDTDEALQCLSADLCS